MTMVEEGDDGALTKGKELIQNAIEFNDLVAMTFSRVMQAIDIDLTNDGSATPAFPDCPVMMIWTKFYVLNQKDFHNYIYGKKIRFPILSSLWPLWPAACGWPRWNRRTGHNGRHH
jgi:hypothetical protein